MGVHRNFDFSYTSKDGDIVSFGELCVHHNAVFAKAPKTPQAVRFLTQAGAVRGHVMAALGTTGQLQPGSELFGVGVAKFATAFHKVRVCVSESVWGSTGTEKCELSIARACAGLLQDCPSSMRAGAVNVLVAKGDQAAHILPEYGLSWVGGDSRLALEATRDALHGNSQEEAWERTCYGAFEQW